MLNAGSNIRSISFLSAALLLGAAAVALSGCDDGGGSTTGAGGEDCWYCNGAGGATASGSGAGGKSTGKGGGGGKGDSYGFVVSGTLNTATGEGSYRLEDIVDGVTVCDVSYQVSGASADPACSSCTFAYSMPLSMPSLMVDTACIGTESLYGTSESYGHRDPNMLMVGKRGEWAPMTGVASSVVEGDDWTFSFEVDFGEGK